MTIEEKAKEYVTNCVSNGQDALSHLARVEGRNGFIRGAKWMLAIVDGWINDNIENYADFGVDTDRLIEDLKKAMEK